MNTLARFFRALPREFTYTAPPIPSSGKYFFTSDEGVEYEVRFGRKQADILAVNVVFGVLNDEYQGEEYSLTNKGEFFSVIKTVTAIVHDFLEKNPHVHRVEFAGEPATDDEDPYHTTKRTRIYARYAAKAFDANKWQWKVDGNKVVVERLPS